MPWSALVDRIGERLAPTAEDLTRRGSREPGPDLFADYMRDIVRRLTADRDATIALFEFRLEAMRRPKVAGVLNQWRRDGFSGDVQFNSDAGLPGGPREIALFHYAIERLVLDRLTSPLMPEELTEKHSETAPKTTPDGPRRC